MRTTLTFYNYENHGTQGPPEKSQGFKPQGFIYKVLFSQQKLFSITTRTTGLKVHRKNLKG